LKRPDGSSKGICFLRFNEEKAVASAIEYSGSEHMGRTIIIEKTKEGGAGGAGGAAGGAPVNTESKTCFIGNLSFYTEVESLRAVFEDCGEIKDVRIAKD
jgi:nucleolin